MAHSNANFIQNDSFSGDNYDALKLQLGAMRGIISMDIDSENHSVYITYDNSFVSLKQIDRCLNNIGYELDTVKNSL